MGWRPSGSRVRPRTKAAMCLMVTGEAKTAREAAKVAGVSEEQFCRVRRSKTGKSLREHLEGLFRQNAGHHAFVAIYDLMQNAKNPAVRMRAAVWLAGVSGLIPTQKAEIKHTGSTQTVGLEVVLPEPSGGVKVRRKGEGDEDTDDDPTVH